MIDHVFGISGPASPSAMQELQFSMDDPVLVPGDGFDGHLYLCTSILKIGRFFHATMTHARRADPGEKVAVLVARRTLSFDKVTEW